MSWSPLLAGDPKHVGAFRLFGRLGAGGMGVVFVGEDNTGEIVAVKVLRPDLANDSAFRLRFRREVEAARRVDGVCTARVLGVDLDARPPYFVSEYIEGPTLDRYCHDHGPLAGEALNAFAIGIAEALLAIHDSGLVHRDLKPSNVLIASRGPMVIDFGITLDEQATSVTRVGESIGSPGWMAPEQARGERVGPPADMFSWGALVAFAATGRAPFGQGSADAVLYRVVHDSPQIEAVPDSLRALVAGALDKQPVRRPDARQVLAALLPGKTSDATQPGTRVRQALDATWTVAAATQVQKPVPKPRGRSEILIGAIVLVLVLCAVAAWAVFGQTTNPARSAAVPRSTSTTRASTTTTVAQLTTPTPPATIPPATPSSQISTVAAQPADGIYVDDVPGTPHYYISITHPANGTLAGAVSFLAQDGQTSPVFNFAGSQQGGAATVQPSNGGSPISVTYGAEQLQLGECTQYLQYVQNLAACTFTRSPQGVA